MRRIAVLICLAFFSSLTSARPRGFYLEQLPHGKDVTIPGPATTYVPLAARVRLTATDMPQSLSLKPININRGPAATIRLAIYDRHSERVQYIDVKPGTKYLYAFKELDSIFIIPELPGTKNQKAYPNIKLQVESNKPLEIAH